MRRFEPRKILLPALSLLLAALPAGAQSHSNSHGLLTPFVCELNGGSDVTARFISTGGTFELSIRTSQTGDGDNAGGVVDRLDGTPLNSLDMDVTNACNSGFEVVFFGSDPITGLFTAAGARCSNAQQTAGKGGFTHLHFTPASFGFAQAPVIIQIYIQQTATTSGAQNVLIKNVAVNQGLLTPTGRLGGCQI